VIVAAHASRPIPTPSEEVQDFSVRSEDLRFFDPKTGERIQATTVPARL
jgi:hypothetical protein